LTGKVLMEEMSWREIEAALASGKNTALIMAGSVEQHGPHLPTGTDAMLGYERGVRLAEALGDALVAPVIRPGLSEHHMSFPGSFTLQPETFKALLLDYCQSLQRHGFENLVLIPTHGGNYGAMEEMLPKLQEALPDCHIILMTREDSQKAHRSIQPRLKVDSLKAGVHAGEVETAMMLAHRPDLVAMEHAPQGWIGEFDPLASQVLNERGIQALSPNGVLGDARGASEELGENYAALWTDIYAEVIRERLR
jgi:creatinine amidohydrolase